MKLLVVLLWLESLGLAALTVFLVVEVLTTPADSLASAIGLVVLTLIAAVWVGAMAIGARRGSPWIRGGAVTVQLLLIAVAIGSFQGMLARPDVGWLLLTPAILILVLLFTRSVLAATRHRDPE
ncbi:MAG: hypothetical protein H7146_13475 [Burkholderiaceae bacterium]|nr:hypothetical protein [Microbacteriaceae bacterium]